jgi:hypothetical protein
MTEPEQEFHVGPRWPGALTILAVVFLLAALPGRISLFPKWVSYVLGAVVLAPMVGTALTTHKGRWLRIERTITLLFCLVVGVGVPLDLALLVRAMVLRPAEISGLQLLASSIGVWVTNVLAFSLVYWQIDRGGPAARASKACVRPDWLFPQEGAPQDVAPDWRPMFVDYIFLGFSTATAFSPTDALPLTARAKVLMMLESSISLVTIVIVASRAINILGN